MFKHCVMQTNRNHRWPFTFHSYNTPHHAASWLSLKTPPQLITSQKMMELFIAGTHTTGEVINTDSVENKKKKIPSCLEKNPQVRMLLRY